MCNVQLLPVFLQCWAESYVDVDDSPENLENLKIFSRCQLPSAKTALALMYFYVFRIHRKSLWAAYLSVFAVCSVFYTTCIVYSLCLYLMLISFTATATASCVFCARSTAPRHLHPSQMHPVNCAPTSAPKPSAPHANLTYIAFNIFLHIAKTSTKWSPTS